MTDPLKGLRLAIVSHVVHFRNEGQLFAYGPYAQEIELWADLFGEIVIASPCRNEAPPGDCLPLRPRNISVAALPELGGETVGAKLKLAVNTPLLMGRLARILTQADAIHVRCPGNLGLLGAIIAPLFSKRIVAKYAAQWNSASSEAWSYRLQKIILRSRWWRGPVTVYGEWPDQPDHVVPFFTSLLTTEHMERALVSSKRIWVDGPLRVLFAGRLSKSKNVDVLLRAVAKTRSEGYDIKLAVVGEGPEESSLRQLAHSLGIEHLVEFTGGVAFEEVISRLEQSHVLALVSETEGWPKSIAEAMAFGLVAIGADRGFVPAMLDEGRGLLARPGDVDCLSKHLSAIARDPFSYIDMRRSAAEWSREFSMEGLQAAIRKLLWNRWDLLQQPPSGAVHDATGGAK